MTYDVDPADFEACARCRKIVELDEFVTNCGVCDECFDIGCPCEEGHPDVCPLHEVAS